MIRLQFAHGRADGPAAGKVGHDLLDHSRIGVSQRTVCRLLDINEGRSALKSRLRFLQAANTYEQARHNTRFRQWLWRISDLRLEYSDPVEPGTACKSAIYNLQSAIQGF